MNHRWYKSALAKGILIIAAHILAVTLAVGFLWIMSYPMLRTELLSGRGAKKYEDSVSFKNNLQSISYDVIEGIRVRDLLETGGAYDLGRIVDIQEFWDKSRISDENVSGLAYTLDELKNWGESLSSDGSSMYGTTGKDLEDHIIVCKKPDNVYYYYYYSEFKKLIDSGELRFVIASDESGISEDDILSELREGSFDNSSETSFKGLQDMEGRVVYLDCWSYDGYWFEEMYPPLGADSIMDVANDNPAWNGRLSDAYSRLRDTINSLCGDIAKYDSIGTMYQKGDTNVAYLYADEKTGQAYSNQQAFQEYEQIEKNLKKLRDMGKYIIVRPGLEDFETNMEEINALRWRDMAKYARGKETDFIFAIAVDTGYPIKDVFYSESQLYKRYGAGVQKFAVLGIALSLLFFVVLIWLTVAAGRNGKDEELHLNFFDRWKTEVAAAAVLAVWGLVIVVVWGNGYVGIQPASSQISGFGTTYDGSEQDVGIGAFIWMGNIAAFTCMMFLIGYMSVVRRVKAKSLWKNSLVRSLLVFSKQLLRNIHSVWKAVLIFGVFVVVHWTAVMSGRSLFWELMMLSAELIVFVYMVKHAIGRHEIDRGVDKIAGGEVDYKISTDGMGEEQKNIAEKINSIGQGLDTALAKSMKSERLKTDLITNVSHDIKTPLTSIINYVNLLKQEKFEDPKIRRYLEVLDEKSQRLKTLTEDVVEASKISSGNITLEFMNINLVEMIQQTSGEFEEKFKERNLAEVMSLPEREVIISADGRRLWRVLANIYNNAAKYAMEGTRVYADLYTTGKSAVFSLKNISEQSLNISADELTERFIRGDISRSTEGSGLGLSIAKTLTEMQGGKFELYLDGDLFRVTLTFTIAGI
ncbi:MAG: HAMP domain-containing histidine kinase [Dorea sp.]|jgi:signal transduction histidine kinase|nr:HAMP domain-containing histidine kinase [Dorea sp.]